jgi:hypothetical protein
MPTSFVVYLARTRKLRKASFTAEAKPHLSREKWLIRRRIELNDASIKSSRALVAEAML